MAGLDVNARLTLDSSTFDAGMAKSGAAVERTARQVERAAERARIAWAKESIAQERAAEKSAEVSRRKELAALQADILARSLEREQRIQEQVTLGLDRWVRAMDGASASAARGVAANNALAASYEHVAVASGVSNIQATQGVIGTISGRGGARAIEAFTSKVLGLGNAMQAIFPVVGGIAFIALITEAISKFEEMRKNAEELPGKLRVGFEELHTEGQIAADTIAVTNDQLETQIAKMERKPENRLKTSLDEGRLAAEQLAEWLDKDISKANDLLSKNAVGTWGKLTGQAGTEEATKFVADTKAKLDAISKDYAPAIAAATSPQNLADLRASELTAYQKVYDAAHVETRRRLKSAGDQQYLHDTKQFGLGSDQRANIAIYSGFDAQLSDEEKSIGGKYEESQLKPKLEGDKAQKSSDEAAKKADELRLKAMEAHVAEWKTLAPVTAKAIYDYWDAQRNAFAAGSAAYNSILEKQASLAEEGARKASETIKKYLEENKRMGEEAAKLPQNPMGAWNRDSQRAAADARDAVNETSAQNARNSARLAEVEIQEQAGRTMTRIAAATELAAVHTREYGAELDRLQRRLQDVQSIDALSSSADDKQKKIDELQKQIAQVQANRGVQVLQDQYNISQPSTSLLVGATSALEDFVRATTDAGATLRSQFSAALASTNQGILRELTSRRTNGQHVFGNVGAEIFRSGTGALLNGAEGSILKGFGFGSNKAPKGTASDPLFVRMASATGNAIASATKDVGGFGGKVLGSLAGLLPAFADGVDNFGGGMALVGEEGPEIVNLPRGSSVTPNSRSSSFMNGGDTHHHHWSVDARGAHDPAQVHAQIMAAAPHIAAAAMQGMQERNRRTPSSRSR